MIDFSVMHSNLDIDESPPVFLFIHSFPSDMTTSKVEFRAIVRFLRRKGRTGAEIVGELRDVYGEELSSSKSFVYNWMREFAGGRTSVFDEKCGGRPMTSETTRNKIFLQPYQTTEESLFENYRHVSTSAWILKSLGVRKQSLRFVLRFLTREMMDHRLECCEVF